MICPHCGLNRVIEDHECDGPGDKSWQPITPQAVNAGAQGSRQMMLITHEELQTLLKRQYVTITLEFAEEVLLTFAQAVHDNGSWVSSELGGTKPYESQMKRVNLQQEVWAKLEEIVKVLR